MEHSPSLRSFILHDLRARLVSEQIRPGERLPSIPQLQARYGAGRSTIRNVLSDLSKEGLVDLAPRRPAAAADLRHDEAWEKHWEEEILLDRHNVLSLHLAAVRLLPPFLAFAARNCTPRTVPGYAAAIRKNAGLADVITFLENLLEGSGGAAARLIPFFLAHSALPYFWDRSTDVRDSCRMGTRALACGNPEEADLAQTLYVSCAAAQHIVRTLASKAGPLPPARPYDDCWSLFPGTEMQYQRIILDLLVRIGVSERGSTGLLPSEQRLAVHYGVSVSTVREALMRLEEAEFTRTVNGRGTFILEHAQIPSAADVPWLEELLMRVLQAAQLLALMMPVCAKEAAARAEAEDFVRLRENPEHGGCQAARAMFHFVVRRQVLHPFRIVLARAGAFCDWGILVSLSRNRVKTRAVLGETSRHLLELLESGRSTDFAKSMADLYLKLGRALRDDLVDTFGVCRARSIYLP